MLETALRDSGTSHVFAVGRNAVPSYNKMRSQSEQARPKIRQLHLERVANPLHATS